MNGASRLPPFLMALISNITVTSSNRNYCRFATCPPGVPHKSPPLSPLTSFLTC